MPNSDITNIAYTNPASGISYTNKDFNSIYSEELDLVKRLSSRWDPTISNESDPGVVLLKENAIIADKENYNIDKNVLEVFPLSVSQYGNARQLYDSLGYGMRWYRAATTEISYTYTGLYLTDNPGAQITIPQFTKVADSTGEYVYTLINPQPIISTNEPAVSIALQGIPTELTLNGVSKITLDNLDADLRIYLPDRMVAENGVFIANIDPTKTDVTDYNWSEWERVQNLESTALGKKRYTFGVLPNSNTCFIQFPQDIGDLIGNGLNIQYLITLGEAGNIPSGTVESFFSDMYTPGGDVIPGDELLVTNLYATEDGEDPEELQDAYRNYKRTVGTFDTLVTCRDYENAIYNLEDTETRSSVASNAVVSDRTNDINVSHHVITLTENGNETELVVDTTTESRSLPAAADDTPVNVKVTTPDMSAFDLGLYILNPIGSTYNATSYAQSFSVNRQYADIKLALETEKSIQHDYIDTLVDKPFIIKNFYDLTGKIITYSKVSDEVADEIQKAVRLALYRDFNARKMEFGVPVDYDQLVSTIKNADSRIKSVILNEPAYIPCVMTGKETEGTYGAANTFPLLGDTAMQKEVLANLIASGGVQLYKFDKNFRYSFGQDLSRQLDEISKITSLAAIELPDNGSSAYDVQSNEKIIITTPSLIAKKTYTYFTKYTWNGSDLPANKPYKLDTGEVLTLTWTADGQTQTNTITAGEIIRSSVEIKHSDNPITLGQTDTIEQLGVNQVHFSAGEIPPCYWILNNRENVLFDSDTTERILDQNEYFFYTDSTKSDLVVLGSGTKISTSGSVTSAISVPRISINTDNLTDKMKSIEWYNGSGLSDLIITEQDQIVLGEGAVAYVAPSLAELSNDFLPLDAEGTPRKFYYKGASSDQDFVTIENIEGVTEYEIRSRLDINAPLGEGQTLLNGQSLSVTKSNSSGPVTLTGPDVAVLFNTGLTITGGNNIDMSAIDTDGTTIYPIALLAYTPNDSTSGLSKNGDYLVVTESTSESLTFSLDSRAFPNTLSFAVPIITTGQVDGTYSINDDSPEALPSNGTIFIEPSLGGSQLNQIELSITLNGTAGSVLVGKINPYNGYYLTDYLEAIGVSDPTSFMNAVAGKIATYSQINERAVYDKTYRVSDGAVEQPLSGDAFWDVDNPYNKFTIAQMRKCDVSVIKSSKL